METNALGVNPKVFRRFFELLISNTGINMALVAVIILVALLLRMTGIGEGLPYLHYYDEPFIASRSLDMLKHGDFDPHWFAYPGFMLYSCFFIDIVHYFYLLGQPATATAYITGLNDIMTFKDTGWIWTISHPSFYLWNRIFVALLGTAIVYYTYLVGKLVSGKKEVGLIGAAIIAVLPVLIVNSRVITPNVPATFFIMIVVYHSLKFNIHHKKADLLNALIFSGFVIATKYNFGVCLILPIVCYAANFKYLNLKFHHGLLLCFLIPSIVFFLLDPYIFSDFRIFIDRVGFQARHYKVLGHGTHTITPGIPHLIFQLGQFRNQLGILLLVISAIGILFTFRFKGGWLFFVFPVVYMAFMVRQRVDFHRNFIALYPFIAIWIGAAFWLAADFLKRYLIAHGSWIKFAFARRWLFVLPYLPISLFVILTASSQWVEAEALANKVETRSLAVDEINKLIPAGDRTHRIAVAKELRMQDQDLRRLHAPYSVIPHMDFKQSADQYAYFITGKYDPKYSQSKRMNAAYKDLKIVDEIDGKNLVELRRPSVNPTVYIYKGQVMSPGRLSVRSLLGMDSVTSEQNDATAYLGKKGSYYTLPVKMEPGTYKLITRIMGNEVQDETAKLAFYFGDKELMIAQSKVNFTEFTTTFKIEQTTDASFSIKFLNDYWNAVTKEDRNFWISAFSVQRLD